MNTRRIRILIPLAVVALIGVGVWQWQSHQQDQKDRIQITANGTVEADEVEVGSQRSARLAMYRVEEGQPVKKGDVIAMLDTSELKAQLDQARGGVLLASGKLKELLRGTRSEELRHAAAQVEQARASVGGADRSLENARKGYHRRTQLKQALDAASTQRRQAEAALKQAESTLAGAEDAVKTAQQDYDTSVQLRQTRDGAAQALESSRAQSRNAQAKLTELVNGERPEVIAAAEAALGQTEQAMRQARDEAANAASDFQRVDEEHRGNAASDQQLDAARTRSETAKAKLGQAE